MRISDWSSYVCSSDLSYIATVENSPSRYFVLISSKTLPDQKLRCIVSDDPYVLGVLSSRLHALFSSRLGGRHGVGITPVYNSRCATAFAFTADPPAHRKANIREEAEATDELPTRVL